MAKKRIYISAPISGHDLAERKAYFAQVAKQLVIIGCAPVNPFDNRLPLTASHADHMRADLRMLLSCDAYIIAADTATSAGCRTEAHVAEACGIPRVGIISASAAVTFTKDITKI